MINANEMEDIFIEKENVFNQSSVIIVNVDSASK